MIEKDLYKTQPIIDMLIIGSGASGLSCALSAKENQIQDVVVLSKTFPTHSQTSQAQGGINAVESTDTKQIQSHIDETIKASHFLAKEEMVKILVENSYDAIKWLDDMGVVFSKDNEGNFLKRRLGGVSSDRTYFCDDYTGLKILQTLYDNCIKSGIEFLYEYYVLDLIIEDEKIFGVIAYDLNSGEIKQILAKNVVLATGGYSGIYTNHTTNSLSSTGEIISIASKRGVKLSNIDFIQFHPTALKDYNILISESARGIGGKLVDENQERFVDELKPRDEVSKAILDKIKLNHQVFLDLTKVDPKLIYETMPQEVKIVKEFLDLDIAKDLIPINISAHYSMGGIEVDSNTKTNIKNLYAIGEVSQSNIHGQNRLGGNSLLELIVFGKRCAKYISDYGNDNFEFDTSDTQYLQTNLSYIQEIFQYEGKNNFYELKDSLGDILFRYVGADKDYKSLIYAKEQINNLITLSTDISLGDRSEKYNKHLMEYVEFRHSLDTALLIVEDSLKRIGK